MPIPIGMSEEQRYEFVENHTIPVFTEGIRVYSKDAMLLSVGFKYDRVQGSHVIIAQAPEGKSFDTFMSLLILLKGRVDVVLETSHDRVGNDHKDIWCEGIDSVVLQSHLYDFEDLLANDTLTGISVLKQLKKVEINFDEHKLIYIYAVDPKKLKPFEKMLIEELDIYPKESLVTVLEIDHIHESSFEMKTRFYELCKTLGIDEAIETA